MWYLYNIILFIDGDFEENIYSFMYIISKTRYLIPIHSNCRCIGIIIIKSQLDKIRIKSKKKKKIASLYNIISITDRERIHTELCV